MDTQITEIIGKNLLINELVKSDIEVAVPARDRGIDLIAYIDLSSNAKQFTGCPLQIKAATGRSFLLDKKYLKFPNLLLVYIWNIEKINETDIYALTYAEALDVCERMGWTETRSWIYGGVYSTSSPSKELASLLIPFKITSREGWWKKITPMV